MGKPRVIAETGAGQHGVASATACALLGLECVVYMGTEDMRRQAPNVERMRLLGAEVAPVEAGRADAQGGGQRRDPRLGHQRRRRPTTSSAPRSARRPYPALVRDLQRVIGDEAREQALAAEGALPARVIACVGGGSNAIGTFVPFLDDDVELIGVEAGGRGPRERPPRRLAHAPGAPACLHGALSSVLADDEGQILEAHSVSAGLDYPGVGPQHAQLRDSGRVRYVAVTDDRGARGVRRARPARGHHPGAGALATRSPGCWRTRGDGAGRATTSSTSLSGRGDKDLAEVVERRLNGDG